MSNKPFDFQNYWEEVNTRRKSVDWLMAFYNDLKDPLRRHLTAEHESRGFEMDWMEQRVRKYGWKRLLDCGCGPGFWFQLWNEMGLETCGIDRAGTAVPKALDMVRALGAVFPVHHAPLTHMPLAPDSADVAVTVKVLIHTPPNEIVATLQELGRTARHLMLLEARYDNGRRIAPHVFDHDFEAISESLGYRVLERERTVRNEIFLIVDTNSN